MFNKNACGHYRMLQTVAKRSTYYNKTGYKSCTTHGTTTCACPNQESHLTAIHEDLPQLALYEKVINKKTDQFHDVDRTMNIYCRQATPLSDMRFVRKTSWFIDRYLPKYEVICFHYIHIDVSIARSFTSGQANTQ